MYGANYYGQPRYGQGPGIFLPPVTKTVSTIVTTTASCSRSILIRLAVSTTVTTLASITKQFQRSVSVTITTAVTFASQLTRTLKLIAASTCILEPDRYTVSAVVPDADAYFQEDYFQNSYFQIGVFSVLNGTATITDSLDPSRSTILIEE